MKLSDFILLNEAEKKSTVLHEGVLIAKRRNHKHMIFLFQLENYYVETYCNLESKAIEKYQIFGNNTPLNPYLEAISLDNLLN